MIKVLVCGACGRMGKEVVKAVDKEEDLELVSAVDLKDTGEDIGEVVGIGRRGIKICEDLKLAIEETKPEVMVDFTYPESVLQNIRISMERRVHCVIGTTGFDENKIEEVQNLSQKYNASAIIAPNFALGAVLLMKFAKDAARYFPEVEIIELHHNQKIDAPSGTAIKTAEMIVEVRSHSPIKYGEEVKTQEMEKIKNVRGGELSGIRIHSVRLPGLVAHQEVLFGGAGQTLTIRHDSLSRESFMPGVIMAIRKVREIKGVIYGLENLL